jgi:hypothetical protein
MEVRGTGKGRDIGALEWQIGIWRERRDWWWRNKAFNFLCEWWDY